MKPKSAALYAVLVLLACLALPVAASGADRPEAAGALIAAAARGEVEQLKRLLATGAPIDARDGAGRTALLAAVDAGRDEAARLLIEAGADINAQAANQDSPWLLAGARGRTGMLERMLQTGRVDYGKRNRYGGNALIPACHYGHVETVKLLLAKSKIDVNQVNNLGWTALLEAIILGDGGPRHTEIVRLLLAHGAKADLADRDGVTPLAHARQRRQEAIVALLTAAGAK